MSRRLEDAGRRHHHAEIDHVVVVALQDHAHDVLADVVHVTLHGGEQNLSLVPLLLSGLITPSLEEMAFLAGEMQREGFTIPLLIGGATTSRAHTAVKIETQYGGPVIHVQDASRAVGVASALLSDDGRDDYLAGVKTEYEAIRVHRAKSGKATRLVSLADARANRMRIEWQASAPPVPRRPGVTVFDSWPLEDLVPRIDWTPFFQTWELAGHYPDILQDPVVGESAPSMGGMLGMLLASRPNTPIRRLVLNDVGAVIPKAAMARIGTYVGKVPRFKSFQEIEAWLRVVLTPFGPLTDAQWRHLTVHNSKQHDDGSWSMNYDPGVAQSFRKARASDIVLWNYYDAIRCPTLLLRGAQSDLLPKDIALQMTQRGPQPELIEFEGIGHAPALMSGDQIKVVRDFLLKG